MELERLIGDSLQRGKGGPSLSQTPPDPVLMKAKRGSSQWGAGGEEEGYRVFSCSWGVSGGGGRIFNSGYPPSFKI